MSEPAPLILASASPRRREILATAGIPFTVRVADIVEELLPGESADEHARRLAKEKAAAIEAPEEAVVLGADTVVFLDEHILGKPADAADARRMLGMLSGRDHAVVTGISIRHPRGVISDAERTRVWFAPLNAEEIEAYVDSGEPMDKAGAYAIQGRASKFIHRIEGCYFNVVGLPAALVYRHLERIRQGPAPAR